MSVYLERYAYTSLHIPKPPNPSTGIIIVIPVFNEKHIIEALRSLLNSTLPTANVEVLIIINQSIDCVAHIDTQNNNTLVDVMDWVANNPNTGIQFYVTKIELPKKHAGVGLARKAGMDEAARRFELIGNNKGVILCFDADCTCSKNYIKEVYSTFKNLQLNGASVNFEHKLNTLLPKEREGIIQYELHLRYYVNGLRKAGYPYAFHTIGSSMAVRSDIYMKAGGMNRRKAGEDFHFLHKVIPYGNFGEITSSTVFPSARTSDRVPFGTGKAMENWIGKSESQLLSYHPQIFNELAELLKLVPQFYTSPNVNTLIKKLPVGIQAYLTKENFETSLIEIKRQSKNIHTFLHRWFNWLNGLKTLHLIHYLRDNHYPSISIKEAASILSQKEGLSSLELLEYYREMDCNFKADQINLKHLYSGHL